MKNITEHFGTLYHPVKAFVVYQSEGKKKGMYVEGYDMGADGCPINAHPLSLNEANQLANALDTSGELKRSFLRPSGLLPKNVLHINPDHNGYAIWYTPKRQVDLCFIDPLDIPNGKAFVPPLLWKASKTTLKIFALQDDTEINENSALYNAPFFNIYADGRVCMGTVKINIKSDCHLEAFMQQWEQYFFNSNFSHVIGGESPAKENIIQLWQYLITTGEQFPLKSLVKNSTTLKQLLV